MSEQNSSLYVVKERIIARAAGERTRDCHLECLSAEESSDVRGLGELSPLPGPV